MLERERNKGKRRDVKQESESPSVLAEVYLSRSSGLDLIWHSEIETHQTALPAMTTVQLLVSCIAAAFLTDSCSSSAPSEEETHWMISLFHSVLR